MFGLAALVRPGARTRTLAAAALVVAFAVEAGQLVHAPWLDALRATRAGALVLGRGFLWSDLACYAAGVAGAAALDRLLTARRRPSGPVLRRETDEPAHGGDAAARS